MSAPAYPPSLPRTPARYPRATIRLRYGRKMLRHGLAQGWRVEWDGDPFPVVTTRIGAVATMPEQGKPNPSRIPHDTLRSAA